MNGSLLTMGVSAFEVLLAGVFGQHYRLHPGAMGTSEPEFSLDDLQRFGSVEEAREAAIESRVDSRMLESLEEWAAWFERNQKIDLKALALNFDRLVEIFQRRHIIVHNAGRVSRRYLQKTAAQYSDPPAIGSTLPVEPDYLQGALDEVNAGGIALCVMAWAKWMPEDREEAGGALLQNVYKLMQVERWEVVAHLAGIGHRIASLEHHRFALRCNHWCARKRLGDVEAVHSEAREWDTSALKPVYRLVRYTLLDELDAALQVLPDALAGDDFTIHDLREWPILQELRADERAQAILAQDESGGDSTGDEAAPGEESGEAPVGQPSDSEMNSR